jgi:spore germination protein GerM
MSDRPFTHRPQRIIAALALALAVALTAACGDDEDPTTTSAAGAATATATATAPASTGGATTAIPTDTVPTMVVAAYFADPSGALVREERAVPEGDPVIAALGELTAGPTGAGLSPALPPGATVLGVADLGDVVTVDFSAAFEENYPSGGAAAEFAILAPLVQTVSEAAGGDDVAITVEGRTPAPAGSQFDWAEPFSPGDVGA